MKQMMTEADILRMVSEASRNMNTFFQQPFVNYRGNAKDSPMPVVEIVAKHLLENPQLLNAIQMIERDGSYKTNTHDGVTDVPGRTGNAVLETALRMYGQRFCGIGKIIDYHTPVKNSRNDCGVGKIDMLSETEQEVYMLALKKRKQPETLLKCALEAFTCYKNVDKKKLLEDFGIEEEKEVSGAVIVPKNSPLHKEYKQKKTAAAKLMDKLGIKMFVITEAIESA